jgi:hypothetical protein
MMPIKSFNFSFKLDAKDLLEYITEKNIAVDIQAFGTAPRQPRAQVTGPTGMLALPAPPVKRLGMHYTIIAFLVAHREGCSMAGLQALMTQSGYSPKSLPGQVYKLRVAGLIKSVGTSRNAKYIATPKAIKQSMVAEHDY